MGVTIRRAALRASIRIAAQRISRHWREQALALNLPYELRIGLRYTRAGRRARRRNGFISFISGISMLGIALGVMALIVVLSVMNGFVSQVRDRMLSVVSHIEVFSLNAPIDWKQVEQGARQTRR